MSRHLVLGALAELRLDGLVLTDRVFQATVHATDLRVVLGRAGVGVRLDGADALGQSTVGGHGLGGEGIELAVRGAARRCIGVVEGALLELAELVEVALDAVDATVDVAAFIQDGVGVAAADGRAVLGERSHLDARACQSSVSIQIFAFWSTHTRIATVKGVLSISLVSVLLLLTIVLLLAVALLLSIATTVAASVATVRRRRVALVVGVWPSAVSNRESVTSFLDRCRGLGDRATRARVVVKWGLTRRSSVPWSVGSFNCNCPRVQMIVVQERQHFCEEKQKTPVAQNPLPGETPTVRRTTEVRHLHSWSERLALKGDSNSNKIGVLLYDEQIDDDDAAADAWDRKERRKNVRRRKAQHGQWEWQWQGR